MAGGSDSRGGAMDDTVSAAALRESEELHRITLLNMSDAVFITDDAGTFTYICPNVDVLFAHSGEAVRAMGRISRLFGRDLVPPGQPIPGGEVRNIEHEIVNGRGDRRVMLVHIKQVSIKGGTILYVCRDITDRKQAEQALRRNEQRLALALEAASMGTWDWQVRTGEMNWSPETHRLFGDFAGTKRPSFDAFMDRLHPADRDRVSRVMNEAMDRTASYETEFRVIGYDSVERWVFGKGRALRNGIPLRMLGVFVDFSERHRVERELRELGGRLIHAHEQERRRLARDLHDDAMQRVTVLAAELEVLRHHGSAALPPDPDPFGRLIQRAKAIGEELHRLSHELHPARLTHLGLDDSVRTLCRELSDAHRIDINVDVTGLPGRIEPDVALGIYRIAQEALQNVVKHSGATRAIATLASAGSEIFLSVVDGGVGFDEADARTRDTLGLVSMRERARLMGGQLIVTSKPRGGTRVELRVPVEPR